METCVSDGSVEEKIYAKWGNLGRGVGLVKGALTCSIVSSVLLPLPCLLGLSNQPLPVMNGMFNLLLLVLGL